MYMYNLHSNAIHPLIHLDENFLKIHDFHPLCISTYMHVQKFDTDTVYREILTWYCIWPEAEFKLANIFLYGYVTKQNEQIQDQFNKFHIFK